MQKEQNSQRYLEIRRVTVIGAVNDLVLGIAKIIFGFFGHSHGLIADGGTEMVNPSCATCARVCAESNLVNAGFVSFGRVARTEWS